MFAGLSRELEHWNIPQSLARHATEAGTGPSRFASSRMTHLFDLGMPPLGLDNQRLQLGHQDGVVHFVPAPRVSTVHFLVVRTLTQPTRLLHS